MDDAQKDAARLLLDTGAVLIDVAQPFTYTSGKKGPVYVDCRRLISYPAARGRLMDMQANIIRAAGAFDFIAGGETAGIPYAAFLADRLDAPMLYVRKQPKGVGRMAQIEGHLDKPDAKIALIEDVQNYGVSVKVFVDALRAAGARVEHLFVIFAHGHASSRATMAEMGITIHALTDWQAVLALAKAEERFPAATIASVERYLADPAAWAA